MFSLRIKAYLEDLLRDLDFLLKKDLGRRTGFVIVLFEVDQPEQANYYSNQKPENIKKAIKSILPRLYRSEHFFPVISKTKH
jgi:hypothetical protein